MDYKIIAAIIGLISGAVGSLLAPWVKWRIEKVRLQFEARKEKIKYWRNEIDNSDDFYSFIQTSTFQDLKKRLTDEELASFYKTWIEKNPNIDTQKSKLSRFHEIVNSIEKEWKII